MVWTTLNSCGVCQGHHKNVTDEKICWLRESPPVQQRSYPHGMWPPRSYNIYLFAAVRALWSGFMYRPQTTWWNHTIHGIRCFDWPIQRRIRPRKEFCSPLTAHRLPLTTRHPRHYSAVYIAVATQIRHIPKQMPVMLVTYNYSSGRASFFFFELCDVYDLRINSK